MPLDPGDIWPVVARAAVGQTFVWEICSQTDDTPCDDAVRDWLHTVDQDDLEDTANELLADQATEVLDPNRSRTVLLDFVDNPYHGTCDDEEGELCTMKPTDGTTTCHRYCTPIPTQYPYSTGHHIRNYFAGVSKLPAHS